MYKNIDRAENLCWVGSRRDSANNVLFLAQFCILILSSILIKLQAYQQSTWSSSGPSPPVSYDASNENIY